MNAIRDNNTLKNVLRPISLGAVMFSSYVGPGFASGTQTVQYFLTKGWIGVFLGVIICGLFALAINLVQFELYRVYRPENYRKVMDIIYRKKVPQFILSNFKDFVSILTVIVSISAQIAAASVLFNTVFGIPAPWGAVIFCSVMVLLALFRSSVFRAIGSFLTLAILCVTLYIGVLGIPKAWPATLAFLQSRTPPTDYGFSYVTAWIIMILFMGNFMTGSDACVVASRGVLLRRRDVVISSLTNVILCVGSTIVYTIVFAAGMPGITSEEIPTLWVIQNLMGGARGAQLIYAILAMSAMLSTGVSLLFAVSNRWAPSLAKKRRNYSLTLYKIGINLLFVILCGLLSSLGIINIVRYGFVAVSALSVPILCILPIVTIPYRIRADKAAGVLDENGIFIHAPALTDDPAE